MTGEYQICKRCVMDTSDPDISFDENGICNHCHKYDERIKNYVFSGDLGSDKLGKKVEEIKIKNRKNDYDCIIGISGGVDSSYVAYLTRKYDLRALAVHIDNGWNSELSVKNIEAVLDKLDIDLYTYVIDWEEFRDLQLAFLKASVPDCEIPTDHAITAVLYRLAKENNLNYIIHGGNYRTESHLPRAWSQGHSDWSYIKGIYKRFGPKKKLKKYPHYTASQYLFSYKPSIEYFRILNYIDYSKNTALNELKGLCNWRDYGGKHYESVYTRFYQGYILPTKFGYDKRRSHLSSLICSNEITREEALEELKKDAYPESLLNEDINFIINKFELSLDEFNSILNSKPKKFEDYPSYTRFVRRLGLENVIVNNLRR